VVAKGWTVGYGRKQDRDVGHFAEDHGAEAIAFGAVCKQGVEGWGWAALRYGEIFAEFRA
jgi:hypothetical protein